jgi:hypothetical protein
MTGANTTSTFEDVKNQAFAHEEMSEKEKANNQIAAADYSGSRKKTDPKEIKLVRKIDWIMMPMLWVMVSSTMAEMASSVTDVADSTS